jgi:hypothetical protein
MKCLWPLNSPTPWLSRYLPPVAPLEEEIWIPDSVENASNPPLGEIAMPQAVRFE